MNRQLRKTMWLMVACGALTALGASSAVIGAARSEGTFYVDGASVPGAATVFDGVAVRTTSASSEVMLKTGERVTLAPNSSARLYHDRFVLQSGLAELRQASTYRVEAAGLRIDSAESGTRLRVASADGKLVKVAVAAGSAEVRNAGGLLVARVLPGVLLQLQPAPASSTTLTGIVTTDGDRFFLTDETTKVKVELRGDKLGGMVGKRVTVVGTQVDDGKPLPAGVTQVLAVSGITATPAAGSSAGAARATGVSGAKLAIIGGVAAAATVGGLAAAGTIGGGSSATVSR
ncbi:MAG: hypothetical protein ABSF25_16665 [Bryobacteraceae bacterium]